MEQLFQVFKEVAETNNITLSAKHLHMSQPSITLQIQNLESEFGARFFDRTNKGVTLTKEGEIFYSHVRRVLEILKDAREQISNMAKDERRLVNLGATLTIGEIIIPKLLALMSKNHPDVEFKVKIANNDIISQDVLEKKLHIGLIEGMIFQYNDLNVDKFWEDELIVMIPHFHPWESRNTISFEELLSERLVTREEGSGTKKIMETILQEKGLDPVRLNIAMELGSTQEIKQVVAAGLGITVISELAVRNKDDEKLFKIIRFNEGPIHRPFNILTNAHVIQTQKEKAFIKLLHDYEVMDRLINENDLESEKVLEDCQENKGKGPMRQQYC
ncbi:LysR family transcriptional regulator [Desulfosporosinus acidiphilus]|uniref:LysR family transcriptional regulator n=1 Tax=Desulfosporosinus acidiphilus TaxID=885581 RepID=UPI0006748AD9|nr:LysR family transcriptional regulator [Desulfosporosinus acidiphilus]